MIKNLLLASLLAVPASAVAQPTPVPAPTGESPKLDEQKRGEAKRLYEDGLSHYNLGEFDLAIASFRKSYAMSQAPGLLFNIAQAFRLKKDYEQATYFYTTYLRLQPDAANRADVEARLAEMQQALEEQHKLDKKPPIGTLDPEGKTTSPRTPAVPPPAPVTTTPPGPTHTEQEAPPAETSGGRSSLTTAGYVTAGAGVALVVTGVVFGSMAKSAESDLNHLSANMGTWTPAEQSRYDAGKRDNTIAIVSFIAGGAAIATGGTLWALGAMKKHHATVAVSPTAHGTAFAVGWSF